MDFYTNLSQYYDELFPPNAKQIRFLAEHCPSGTRVLDIGAGTGGYSAALAGTGTNVEALEIGAMYPKLQITGKEHGFRVREMGMEQIGDLESDAYDRVICIGNTVVHLGDIPQVAAFLSDCRRLLKPGGALILQIVNYDRIQKHNQTALPRITLPDKGLDLERRYIIGSESVQFITKLTVRGQEYISETRLLALRRKELLRYLAVAGFGRVDLYGDFESVQWDEDSPATIMVARI